MKKVFFAVLLIFTFALLTGGSCGPKEEIPVEPTTTTVTEPTTPVEEPVVDKEPEIKPLESKAFQVAYFDFDKYNIRSDARKALEANAALLKQYPNARVVIEGHCDERGTVEYNLALGERRAKACKDYMASLGVEASRMETISYGKERPVALGHNEEAWQLNRRGQFTVK